MSLIQPPAKKFFDARNQTTRMVFEGDSKKLDGEYYLRGGVCWPMSVMTEQGERLIGGAVLCGQDVETGRVLVFEETEFVCIDHIVSPADGRIDFRGVCDWFNQCWQRYYGRTFFYNQDPVTHRRFLLEVLRSRAIEPKPIFLEAVWHDKAVADNAVWHLREINRLFYRDDLVCRAITQKAARADIISPVFNALRAALWGFGQIPFRRRD